MHIIYQGLGLLTLSSIGSTLGISRVMRLVATIRRCFSSPTGVHSHVAVGRRYEEACQVMLRTLGITTHHVGGALDGGIDLLGTWHLSPTLSTPILVQCKYIRRSCPPAIVRELEGAAARHVGTAAWLVGMAPASEASLQTMRESTTAMVYLWYDMARVRKAFVNSALMRRFPKLLVGSRHLHGEVEPVFLYLD